MGCHGRVVRCVQCSPSSIVRSLLEEDGDAFDKSMATSLWGVRTISQPFEWWAGVDDGLLGVGLIVKLVEMEDESDLDTKSFIPKRYGIRFSNKLGSVFWTGSNWNDESFAKEYTLDQAKEQMDHRPAWHSDPDVSIQLLRF